MQKIFGIKKKYLGLFMETKSASKVALNKNKSKTLLISIGENSTFNLLQQIIFRDTFRLRTNPTVKFNGNF